jgi:hypothetical protein
MSNTWVALPCYHHPFTWKNLTWDVKDGLKGWLEKPRQKLKDCDLVYYNYHKDKKAKIVRL